MVIFQAVMFDKPLQILNQEGVQKVYLENQLVSEQSHAQQTEHKFEYENAQIALALSQIPDTSKIRFSLLINNELVQQEEFLYEPKESSATGGKLGLLALGFKLFKSAKAVKAALAAASVAGYSWLFSFEFALVLIACLVVHEYGHVRAMKYFGIKTKGIYLIPFVGGLAVSDEKITTRWQDVVISIMGPVFGLLMAVACLVIYKFTEIELFAGAAVLSALLNLFNLLPMLPLDGGHVLKSVSFSMRSWVGLAVCMAGVALGLYISYVFGLYLLVMFLILGSLEILFEWRQRHYSHLVPLDRYGQVVSSVWYVVTALGHIAIIYAFADSENPILKLPMQILSS